MTVWTLATCESPNSTHFPGEVIEVKLYFGRRESGHNKEVINKVVMGDTVFSY